MRWVKDYCPIQCKCCWKTFYANRKSWRKYCSAECWHRDREYDLIWKIFWKLKVIKKIWMSNKWDWVHRKCRCECGKIVERPTSNLTSWKNQSCGCGRRINNWLTWTKFYHKYSSMRVRCENKSSDNYSLYWWRWIKCEWRTFQDFCNDMYESYIKHCNEFWEWDTTIERINPNWNYCKENCTWATCKEQSNNTRRNRFIEYWWVTLTATQWAERIWITPSALNGKLKRWVPMERIVKHKNKRWYKHYNLEIELAKYT